MVLILLAILALLCNTNYYANDDVDVAGKIKCTYCAPISSMMLTNITVEFCNAIFFGVAINYCYFVVISNQKEICVCEIYMYTKKSKKY